MAGRRVNQAKPDPKDEAYGEVAALLISWAGGSTKVISYTAGTVTLAAVDAYGDRDEDMVGMVPRDSIPDDMDIEVDMMLQMETEDGIMPVRVVEIAEDSVTLDANHPLAGEALTFEVTLVEIV